ncbi:MAG: HAD family hydrolase [Acidobacteriota bacterium]
MTASGTLTVASGLALIFDMDGVLIDSNPLHGKVWRQYLQKFSVSAEDLDTKMQGKRNDDILRALFGAVLSHREIQAHGAAKEALYRQSMASQLEENLMPGLRNILNQNRHRPLGVGSNAEPANIDLVLDGAQLRGYFRAVVDGDQVAKPKPAPDIYLRVADLLAVAPHNCIVFEDSPSGITAARARGARVVGICRLGRNLPGTDLSIRDFADPALTGWLSAQEQR